MKTLAARWPRIATRDDDGAAHIGARLIYILPSKFGLVYAVLLLICLIGAVNYSNNPAFLLTFLLAGLGANAIYQTWRNLNAISVAALAVDPVFAGTQAGFRFRVTNRQPYPRPALQLHWRDEQAPAQVIDLDAAADATVTLTAPTTHRGRRWADTVVISTRYPLGLLRAWCYVDCDAYCLVYPCPVGSWRPPPGQGGRGDDAGDRGDGSDDFRGLRNYRTGDSPAHVHWKALAREQGLQTKLFGGDEAPQLWLEWQQTDGDDEIRLRQLCRGLLDAESAGARYGLRMPTTTLAPDCGDDHLHRCLALLALHGDSDPDAPEDA